MMQHGRTTKIALRLILMSLVLATTSGAAWMFYQLIASDGWTLLDLPMWALFILLFGWIAFAFWSATIGYVRYVYQELSGKANVVQVPADRPERATLPRTVIVMPIYHESPREVLAGLRTTLESLAKTGRGESFDFFLLSDSTDPDHWLGEQNAWARLKRQLPGQIGVYYRKRPDNIKRKAGNIAQFCEKWGGQYKYMVVFDADSLMSGATLVEMVQRMEDDPRLGILQAPPDPVNQQSLFARCQQFACSVYGPIFTAGLGLWAQTDGNYWGHNAIIRVAPFMKHCGLPDLPGKRPLGGEILSHDFVEAALMRRAGYSVRIAPDLDGSYEQVPATMIDFAKRDQRWCQGNLQHVRLVFSYGLHVVSRLHLGMGVMSYLASPLWLAFTLLGVIHVAGRQWVGANGDIVWSTPVSAVVLFAWTMALLLLPKLWGLLAILSVQHKTDQHGGLLRAVASVIIESLVSIAVAPIFMAFHATFVVTTLMGKSVQWGTQNRNDSGTSFAEAVNAHALHTIAGLLGILLIGYFATSLFWWTLPITGALALSIPISMVVSDRGLGRVARRLGLLLIPEEYSPPPLLQRYGELLAEAHMYEARTTADDNDIDTFTQTLVDPVAARVHLDHLSQHYDETPPSDKRMDLDELVRVVSYGSCRYLTADDRLALLTDADAFAQAHRGVWAHWPVDRLLAVTRPNRPPA